MNKTTNKEPLSHLSIRKTEHYASCFLFLLLFTTLKPLCFQTAAKDKINDNLLLDQFIASKGYSNTIVFDSSNIKQFWGSKSILSKDNTIEVILDKKEKNGLESDSFPIQLKNVNWSHKCKIEVITKEPNLTFTIKNKKNPVSTSSMKEPFLDYNVYSSYFNMCDVPDYAFFVQFSSIKDLLKIEKIVLSFSSNDVNFLHSPGVLSVISPDNSTIKTVSLNRLSSQGVIAKSKKTSIISSKTIEFGDTPIKYSVKLKNIGDAPARIYVGYTAYTNTGKKVDTSNYPISDKAETIKVLSVDESNNSLLLKTNAVPGKRSIIAYNVKDDFSDLPNFNLLPGEINETHKESDGTVRVAMSKPLEQKIKEEDTVRVHARGGTYIYINNKVLTPGEEYSLTSVVKKSDQSIVFRSDDCPKDVMYITPVLLSNSTEDSENTIQINEFSVEY